MVSLIWLFWRSKEKNPLKFSFLKGLEAGLAITVWLESNKQYINSAGLRGCMACENPHPEYLLGFFFLLFLLCLLSRHSPEQHSWADIVWQILDWRCIHLCLPFASFPCYSNPVQILGAILLISMTPIRRWNSRVLPVKTIRFRHARPGFTENLAALGFFFFLFLWLREWLKTSWGKVYLT